MLILYVFSDMPSEKADFYRDLILLNHPGKEIRTVSFPANTRMPEGDLALLMEESEEDRKGDVHYFDDPRRLPCLSGKEMTADFFRRLLDCDLCFLSAPWLNTNRYDALCRELAVPFRHTYYSAGRRMTEDRLYENVGQLFSAQLAAYLRVSEQKTDYISVRTAAALADRALATAPSPILRQTPIGIKITNYIRDFRNTYGRFPRYTEALRYLEASRKPPNRISRNTYKKYLVLLASGALPAEEPKDGDD